MTASQISFLYITFSFDAIFVFFLLSVYHFDTLNASIFTHFGIRHCQKLLIKYSYTYRYVFNEKELVFLLFVTKHTENTKTLNRKRR